MNHLAYENQLANFLPVIKEGQCPKCGGLGYLSKDLCHFCYGTGLSDAAAWDAEFITEDEAT
jgi:hypothetical protein